MNIGTTFKQLIGRILKLLGKVEYATKKESGEAPKVSSEESAKDIGTVPKPTTPFDSNSAVASPVSVSEQTPIAVTIPASESEVKPEDAEPNGAPIPVLQPGFTDTPEKTALDEQVLSSLKAFQEKAIADGVQPQLVRFSQFFEKTNGISLKNAIKQVSEKCGISSKAGSPKIYLSEVPGIEVFDQGLIPCIRLKSSPERWTEGNWSAPRDSLVRKEESKPSLKSILSDIRKYAAWNNPEGHQMLAAAKNQLATHYPGSIAEGRRCEQTGRRYREIMDKAYRAGAGSIPFSTILEMLTEAGLYNPFNKEQARKKYDMGIASQRRWAEAQSLKRRIKSRQSAGNAVTGKGVSQKATKEDNAGLTALSDAFDAMFGVKPAERTPEKANPVLSIGNGTANVLTSLDPSAEWTVLVDETGWNYSSDATGNNRGRLVALFVPRERPLANLPEGWHAVEQGRLEGPEGVLALVGRIQSAKCGLLGIPITLLPYTTQADQWCSCLEDLLALSFRLLPLAGKTRISLFVEQRGAFAGTTGTAMLEKTVTDVLHRLARVFPERAKSLSVNGKVIEKVGHNWNGYVDAAAFTWGSPTIQFFLKETGWLGSCFLDQETVPLLRRALDALRSEDVPDAMDWRKLLMLVDADNEASLVSAFLNALGQEAQANAKVWRTYLDETCDHLDSKAIDIKTLGRQLQWLKRWQPEKNSLPPRMRLLWLSSQLSAANHVGRTDLHEADAFRKEFDELCERLRREDCPLVAHAKLHLAVSYTNAFEFEKARDLLRPMHDWPIEGMGLRMSGRLLSSLGQHEAFLGDSVGALPFFDEAIALFRDLSEKSHLEILQTSAYAATASMDAGAPDADERLAAYLWGGPFSGERLVSEARRLAASAEPVEKYAHHILLRRLVELPTDHSARAAYLAEKDRWSEPAVGHPWELIEFYRALLLLPGPERDARLESAYELAIAEGGPTLQVIAAVIAGAAVANADAAARESYANLVACCAEALPALGEARLAALRGQLDPATRLDPLALARAVLPFNFR